MSNFSIILLREGNVGVKQYHFGTKLLFFLLTIFLISLSAMLWKFFDQSKIIETQGQLLEKQEKTQMAFQQRIDLYDGREDRISFLEAYVEELKHFTNCVAGKETLVVGPEEMFSTMETIFAIERSLSSGKSQVKNDKVFKFE